MVQSLRFRLRVLLLLMAAPGVAFVFYHGIAERIDLLEVNRSRGDRVQARLADDLTRQVAQVRETLDALVAMEVVQTPASPACQELLTALLTISGHFQTLVVAEVDGIVHCGALPSADRVKLVEHDYFRAALRTRTFAVGTLAPDPLSGEHVIGFAAPIPRAAAGPGELAGVAVATVAGGAWDERLRLFLPSDAVAYLSDSTGRIIAAAPADQGLRGRPVVDLGVPATPEAAASAETVAGADGRRRVFSVTDLRDESGQGVGRLHVGMAMDASLAEIRQRSLTRLLGLATALAVAWWAVSRLAISGISRPLNVLSDSIDAVDGGMSPDAAKRRWPPEELSNVSELQALGRRVQGLAGARHAAERAELRQREEMAALLEALPDIYFRINRDGVVLDWRGKDASDLLVPPDRFLGRRLSEVVPANVLRLFEEHMERHLETGTVETWEYAMEIAGESRHFEARACPVSGRDETVLVVRNITDRKRTEESLETAVQIFEASSEGMIVTDARGRIASVNPAIANETGFTKDALLGRQVADLVEEPGRVGLLARIDGRDGRPAGAPWTAEVRLQRAAKGSYPAWATLNAIHSENGEVTRWLLLTRDMTEIKAANDEIRRNAELDELTGLANRRGLTRRLAEACTDATRKGKPLALLFMDVDRLKPVNDRLGHRAGDAVLVELAERLRSCIRDGDIAARQAGDEFIVVLPGSDAVTRSQAVSQQILAETARPFPIGEETVRLSASMGIALYPLDADDPHLLLAAADQAMFEAKTGGRNRARRFSAQIRQSASDRIRLLDELHRGLDGGQFDLHYQPIVDLATGVVAKAEALIRWHHPDLGPISPVRFIPLAESSRLIRPLGDWTLRRATADLPRLRARFGDAFQVSLNLSPAHLTATSAHDDLDWAEHIAGAGFDRPALIVEVTEGALLEPDREVVRRLAALREVGAQVALDDFGTGYSSLLYFLRHDFDFLKIDRAFVHGLAESGRAAVLCETMLRLARGLGCRVIAEGIENPKQVAALRQSGCEFGQGFFFSRPLPISELVRLPQILSLG